MTTIIFGSNGKTLPGASVFESTATGDFAEGGSAMISDDNGSVVIPDGLAYVTARYIGYDSATFAGYEIPAQITLAANENLLSAVNITAPASADWLMIGLFIACIVLLYLIFNS